MMMHGLANFKLYCWYQASLYNCLR